MAKPPIQKSEAVFQTDSPMRWKLFTGAVGIFLCFFVIISISVLSAIYRITPVQLIDLHKDTYKTLLNPGSPFQFRHISNAEYARMRHTLTDSAEFKYSQQIFSGALHSPWPLEPLRAGFYVNWDAASYSSLQQNIDKLNLVLPEWIFVPDSGCKAAINVDEKALHLLHEKKIPIIPMISNFFNDKWNGKNVERIIKSPHNRKEFIQSIIEITAHYGFAGVNIDFEELNLPTDEILIQFQKELYQALHEKGLIVTQDISPGNLDYNASELSKWNDFLFLMAYDQHYPSSTPGPISDIHWIEQALATTLQHIPPQKVVLCMAAYGYDWAEKSEGQDITWQEAILYAREFKGIIDFNNDNYNCSFQYTDDEDISHKVWFTDAATCYNVLRTSEDFALAGTALWRLGSEDPRIWEFYRKRHRSSDPMPSVAALSSIARHQDVDFSGEGELLDIIAEPEEGIIHVEADSSEHLISEEFYKKLPTSFAIQKYGKADKSIVLTFDDGPDPEWTPQILDLLKKENVPAAFFIVGINAEKNLDILERIWNEGHDLGNHSFSHPNLALVSADRALVEINSTGRIIECITGHSSILFRPPYNADAEPHSAEELIPVALAKKLHYITVGESIDPLDWQEGISANTIVSRIKNEEHNGSIILLHDAGGNRQETIKALPEIIHYFKSKGYKFVSIADFLNVKKSDLYPPVSDPFLNKINRFFAELLFRSQQIILILFFVGIILSLSRLGIITILAWQQKRKEKVRTFPESMDTFVSIIVPAYNEGITITKTIQSLLATKWINKEIIIVNDGSTDDTYAICLKEFSEYNTISVYDKPNGGKASALNFGIARAKGEIVICIDGDTLLDQNAINELLKYFDSQQVSAVAGNVKAGNTDSLLGRIQSLEYITSQNLDRRAFHLINGIMVIPGAIGAFRKDIIIAAGGFTRDTLAEDCDLTLALLSMGYRVEYAPGALAYTEVPEKASMFLRQRFRWTYGILQAIWKHRYMLWNKDYPVPGFIILPNALIFNIILPLISPLADILMILSFAGGYWQQTLVYYLIFTFCDLASAIIAYTFGDEKKKDLWLLFFQRFFYRQIIYFVVFKALITAIRGSIVGWGFLQRSGKAKVQASA
jgi:cellulose synthase/poly-beta-1,6-N-acetylglucosamine synthase-like glycosyltransferase/spore germination protein YaaH